MTHHHAAAASRVQEIVKMANMIKAMNPSERAAHLDDLSRGADVNIPRALVDALFRAGCASPETIDWNIREFRSRWRLLHLW